MAVSVSVCATVAPWLLSAFVAEEELVLLQSGFFMWFCISGTRVGHRCLFLEMFPELVQVWETIV